MADLRRDLRGEAVIVSPGRADRPYDFNVGGDDRRQRCPFCPGREAQTPPEVDAVRREGSEKDKPGWQVRVVPNRYPAFPREPDGEGSAYGVHEVIIETPDHARSLVDLTVPELVVVMDVWRRRIRVAREDPAIHFASIFKNHGARAGASLEHAHSQLMAVPFVPQRVAAELAAWRDGSAAKRLALDLEDSALQVLRSDHSVVVCPSFARFSWESWIMPLDDEARFEDTSDQTLQDAAVQLHSLLRAMNQALEHPHYHLLVSTAPLQTEGSDSYRWRIELFPRLAQVAGFEWATGVFVNQTPPESAAEGLRAQATNP